MSGRVWVLVGASGSGKTTLAKELGELPGCRRAVTCTTRAPRPGEVEGLDYHFVSEQQFDFLLASGALLESTEYGGARYGLPEREVTRTPELDVLCVLDLAGVHHLRALLPAERLATIYLAAPSASELERRMRERGSQDTEIAGRLALRETEERDADLCEHVVPPGSFPEVKAAVLRLMGR